MISRRLLWSRSLAPHITIYAVEYTIHRQNYRHAPASRNVIVFRLIALVYRHSPKYDGIEMNILGLM